MATYSDFVRDGYQRPIPGATAKLFTPNGATQVAIATTGADGQFTFDVVDGKYLLEVSFGGASDRSSVIVGNPPEYVGLTGPANSTYTSLAALKAAPSTNASYILTTTTGPITYAYVTGNFIGKADDVNVVALNGTPLVTGALVRQSSDSVSFVQAGTGAVVRGTQNKARETVSLLDFGAVGNEAANDTIAVNNALATGADVFVPEGYTFSVTSVGSTMVDDQRIYGGGTIKKRLLGSVYAPADAKSVFVLPDASTGIILDGITIDGNTSVLPAGAPVSAIFAKVPRSLTVRNASLVNLRDCGVKVWSGARITVDNCLIDGAGTGENGVELHNYAIDPNAGVPFPAGLPPVTGDHFITRNRIRHFTRYEPTDGSLIVDATGVNFPAESGAPRHRRVTVTDNEITDCLRGVWTENNYANTEVDGFTIERNTITCGVSGGTAQGIFGKVGIGIIGGKNGLVRGNRLRNVSNHNPTGSTTAGITLSGSAGVTTNGNVEVSGNQIIDDSGLAQRTQVGINVVLGSDIRVHDNFVSGASVTPIYIDPSLAASVDCHSNRGAQDEYSWINPVALTPFVRTAIPASLTDGATYPNNLTFETEIVAHAAGRLVALVSKLDNAFSAGSLTAKVYVNSVEQTSLRIIGSDFAGGVIAIKRQAATSGIQVRAGQRIKVTLTTDAAFAPATLNGSFTAILDTGVKQ